MDERQYCMGMNIRESYGAAVGVTNFFLSLSIKIFIKLILLSPNKFICRQDTNRYGCTDTHLFNFIHLYPTNMMINCYRTWNSKESNILFILSLYHARNLFLYFIAQQGIISKNKIKNYIFLEWTCKPRKTCCEWRLFDLLPFDFLQFKFTTLIRLRKWWL